MGIVDAAFVIRYGQDMPNTIEQIGTMQIAILADIHGNLAALTAVMAELERLQPDYVVVNGDLINAVPFSAEVIDLVRAQNWVVVRGNHEFYYLDFGASGRIKGCIWGCCRMNVSCFCLVPNLSASRMAFRGTTGWDSIWSNQQLPLLRN